MCHFTYKVCDIKYAIRQTVGTHKKIAPAYMRGKHKELCHAVSVKTLTLSTIHNLSRGHL